MPNKQLSLVITCLIAATALAVAQSQPKPQPKPMLSGTVLQPAPHRIPAALGFSDAAKRALIQKTYPTVRLPGVFETIRLTPGPSSGGSKATMIFNYPAHFGFDGSGGGVEFLAWPLVEKYPVPISTQVNENVGSADIKFDSIPGKSYVVTIGLSWISQEEVARFVVGASVAHTTAQTFSFRHLPKEYWEGRDVLTVFFPATSGYGHQTVNITSPIEEKRWRLLWVEIDPL